MKDETWFFAGDSSNPVPSRVHFERFDWMGGGVEQREQLVDEPGGLSFGKSAAAEAAVAGRTPFVLCVFAGSAAAGGERYE